ncbi:FAD-dependent oxidoreductase [Streptomyces sp. NPDC021218]|uniref:FAD-dependent oxidoreductase n=1 Tax=unclassified Streptomyces TaxID=2593676 RepID=UPI0036972FDC
MSAPADVLVVGASAAGLSTAEALRRKGFQGGLTVLGAEPHPPYDRPPLSKQILSGTWEPDLAFLHRTAELFRAGRRVRARRSGRQPRRGRTHRPHRFGPSAAGGRDRRGDGSAAPRLRRAVDAFTS